MIGSVPFNSKTAVKKVSKSRAKSLQRLKDSKLNSLIVGTVVLMQSELKDETNTEVKDQDEFMVHLKENMNSNCEDYWESECKRKLRKFYPKSEGNAFFDKVSNSCRIKLVFARIDAE